MLASPRTDFVIILKDLMSPILVSDIKSEFHISETSFSESLKIVKYFSGMLILRFAFI